MGGKQRSQTFQCFLKQKGQIEGATRGLLLSEYEKEVYFRQVAGESGATRPIVKKHLLHVVRRRRLAQDRLRKELVEGRSRTKRVEPRAQEECKASGERVRPN